MDNKDCKTCDIPNQDPLLDGNCVGDDSTNNDDSNNGVGNGCTTSVNGVNCPTVNDCTPWDLTQNSDTCVIDGYIAESLNIGGAVVNVHKLLGVHEQGKLQDLTGNGNPISNGDHPNFPSSNAFDRSTTEWKSLQLGADVLSSAYVGYDFGEIKLENGRLRYGVETFVKKDVSTINIRQGCEPNRVTKVRVERSDNGDKWYGVAIVNVENCSGMVTLNFRRSVPSRFWRIRPLEFNGGATDTWDIQALQLVDYDATHITNIQDRIFLENRDRDYDEYAVRMKGAYQPVESSSFLSKFGFSGLFNMEQLFVELSFTSVISALGRPFVIGDIIQLPSETQYSPSLRPVLKYLEVTDVGWASSGFSPSWQPTIQRIVVEPVTASQETQDLFGKLTPDYDTLNTSDIDDGLFNKPYQDISAISQTINAEQNTQVPEKGADYANITKLSEEAYAWAKKYPDLDIRKLDRIRDVYGTDAMPPNGLPYTEGDDFPLSPIDGDYHRLSYVSVGKDIPVRLHRFSSQKNRWIYMETDRRDLMRTRSLLQEFIDEARSTKTDIHDIDSDFKL